MAQKPSPSLSLALLVEFAIQPSVIMMEYVQSRFYEHVVRNLSLRLIRRLDKKIDLTNRLSIAENLERPYARLVNHLLKEEDPIQSQWTLPRMFFNPHFSPGAIVALRTIELNAYVCTYWVPLNHFQR